MFFFFASLACFFYWLWTLPFEPRFYGEGTVTGAWNLTENSEEK